MEWIWNFLFGKSNSVDPELERLTSHPRYDAVSMRIRLPRRELEDLPVRSITHDEAYELMCEWEWNSPMEYAHLVTLYPGEIGHDRDYRYTVPA